MGRRTLVDAISRKVHIRVRGIGRLRKEASACVRRERCVRRRGVGASAMSALPLRADQAPRQPGPMPHPTWAQLARLEPGLARLRREARAVDGRDPHFCANRVWYQDFKPRLLPLVGWCRDDGPAVLRTQAAYALAYDTIYQELPGCRGCWCIRPEDF